MTKDYQKVAILNVETIINTSTGDRVKAVTSGHIGVYRVDLVGVQTQQILQAQNVLLSYSVEVPRRIYNNEKYCYFNNQLFEIVIATKAKEPTNMNLNIKKIEDKSLDKVIKNWLEAQNGI